MLHRDTRDQFKDRLKKDLKLPDGQLTDALMDAATAFCREGYVEAGPLLEKYADLVCPWDGKLHRNSECDKQAKEFERKHPAVESTCPGCQKPVTLRRMNGGPIAEGSCPRCSKAFKVEVPQPAEARK
ncbi:MAG: hypothetical protein HY680_10545 [Chloroflexi bacterium]|nr:hypothetical protein [Chloroflexota bacterium]